MSFPVAKELLAETGAQEIPICWEQCFAHELKRVDPSFQLEFLFQECFFHYDGREVMSSTAERALIQHTDGVRIKEILPENRQEAWQWEREQVGRKMAVCCLVDIFHYPLDPNFQKLHHGQHMCLLYDFHNFDVEVVDPWFCFHGKIPLELWEKSRDNQHARNRFFVLEWQPLRKLTEKERLEIVLDYNRRKMLQYNGTLELKHFTEDISSLVIPHQLAIRGLDELRKSRTLHYQFHYWLSNRIPNLSGVYKLCKAYEIAMNEWKIVKHLYLRWMRTKELSLEERMDNHLVHLLNVEEKIACQTQSLKL